MRTANATAASAREQDQFIAIIAHELRHPLVPIRNAAALLKHESADAATIRRAADIIERQASGMNRLIGELMERAVESAKPFASERGHTLSVSVTPAPTYLHMDVLRLVQSLHQIITNATRYTERCGHIHVRAKREGAEVVVTVSDTGIGIPVDDLETIFGLFVHAAHGARIEQGLGLGLYLARYLIEAHEGTVMAASAGLGRGSVFTIRLPCESPARDLPAEPVSPAEASAADRSPV